MAAASPSLQQEANSGKAKQPIAHTESRGRSGTVVPQGIAALPCDRQAEMRGCNVCTVQYYYSTLLMIKFSESKKLDYLFCYSGTFNLNSFKAKLRKKLNSKIQSVLKEEKRVKA
jgi:hypothetical protein